MMTTQMTKLQQTMIHLVIKDDNSSSSDNSLLLQIHLITVHHQIMVITQIVTIIM